MSKRIKKKRKRSNRSTGPKHTTSRRDGLSLAEQFKVLDAAIDDDPFEIIGFVGISAAGMQSRVGRFFDDHTDDHPRLRSVLHATLETLPFVNQFARPEPIDDDELPLWLLHLDQAGITAMMRRADNRRRDRSTYLVEVTMVPGLVATGVFGLEHGRQDQIVSFCTIAGYIDNAAAILERGNRREQFEDVDTIEGCQHLLIAFDGSLHGGRPAKRSRAPWPLNMPTAALVIDLATGQIEPDDEPYLATRLTEGPRSKAARELRRSLPTWPREPSPA